MDKAQLKEYAQDFFNKRVVRGPTWRWGTQGGLDAQGTATETGFSSGDEGIPCFWLTVRWDNGDLYNYRIGPFHKDIVLVEDNYAEL